MNWLKSKRICIALDTKEEKQLANVRKQGFGIKEIFKKMLDALDPVEKWPTEEIGDGVNKSGIMRNLPNDPRNKEEEI